MYFPQLLALNGIISPQAVEEVGSTHPTVTCGNRLVVWPARQSRAGSRAVVVALGSHRTQNLHHPGGQSTSMADASRDWGESLKHLKRRKSKKRGKKFLKALAPWTYRQFCALISVTPVVNKIPAGQSGTKKNDRSPTGNLAGTKGRAINLTFPG